MAKRSDLFRARLQAELQKRTAAHGKYSFRAFAHSLKLALFTSSTIVKFFAHAGANIWQMVWAKKWFKTCIADN